MTDTPSTESTTARLHWRESYPVFASIMRQLIGSDSPKAIANYLGHAISPQRIREWKAGRSGIPAWAIEITRQQAALLNSKVEALSPAPGKTGDIHHKRKTPAP